MGGRLVLVVGMVTLGLASPASAAVVSLDETTGDTTFTAGPNEENGLEIRFTTIDDDDDPGTPEVEVVEYRDLSSVVVTTDTPDYCLLDSPPSHAAYCVRVPDTLHYVSLGDGNDRIRVATDETEIIDGGPGNDLLIGRGGNDVLDGGPGDDLLEQTEGSCSDEGGSLGADALIGGTGRDNLDATCREAATSITLDGQANDGSEGEGDDVGSDIEVIEGSDGGTRFVGDGGPNVFKGGDGPTEAIGEGGDDELYGGVEDDTIDGGPGDDVVMGYGGGDTIDGGPGMDQVEGEGGSTITDGTGGPDRIMTADGFQDTVACGSGADSLVADSIDIIAAPGFSGTCEQVTIVAGDGGPGGAAPGGGAPSGASPPPVVASDAVRVAGRSARVKRGSARVKLRCAGPRACRGTLALRLKRRGIGSARFSIPAGASRTVGVKLNRAGRRALRRKRTLRVVARLKPSGGRASQRALSLRRA
jgi:hypothetical protein